MDSDVIKNCQPEPVEGLAQMLRQAQHYKVL